MDRVEKLRRFKEREHLSYERLARLVDVSFMSLYRWIKVGIPPRNRDTIRKVDGFLSKASKEKETHPLKKPLRRAVFTTHEVRRVVKGRRETDLFAFSGQKDGRTYGGTKCLP